MYEGNNPGSAEGKKGILVARVDERVVPALDLIATTNQVNTARLMSQVFGDIADAVEFLAAARGGTFNPIADMFAKLIVKRCPDATPEELRAMESIWARAAELKTQEGAEK